MADLARLVIQVKVDRASQTIGQLRRLQTNTVKLSRSARDLQRVLDRTGDALGEFGDEAEDATQELDDLEQQTSSTTRTTASFASGLKTAGRSLIGAFTVPLTAAATASSRFSLDLNQGLAATQSLLTGTFEENSDRILTFRDAVTAAAVDTGESFDVLTDGLYQSISAFQDGEDAVDRFNTAVQAGIAGGAETSDAVRLLAAVTRAYGDTTAEATQMVSDFAFETIRLGVTDLRQLADSIVISTDRTARLGVTQQELFAVMATLTGVTGDAAQVNTQLRSALDSLLTPSDALIDLYGRLGVSSGEALVRERGLIGAFREIEQAARQSNRPLQDFIQRKEGITAVSRLATTQFDRYVDSLNSITNRTGATNDALQAQREGINQVGFQLRQIRARFEVLGDQLARSFLPIVADLLEVFVTIAETIVERIGPGFLTFNAVVLGSIGPLLLLAGTLLRINALLIETGVAAETASSVLKTANVVFTAVSATIALIGFVGRETERRQRELTDAQREEIMVVEELSGVITLMNAGSEDANDALDELITQFPELAGQLEDVRMAGADATDQLYEIAGAILDLQAAADINRIQGMIDDLVSIEEVEEAMEILSRQPDLMAPTPAPVLSVDPLTTNPALERVTRESMIGQELQDANNLLEQYRANTEQIDHLVENLNVKYANSLFHFEEIDGQIQRVRGSINDVDNGADGVTARLLDWREAFQGITGVQIEEFGEVIDEEAGEFTGSGIDAANAYIANLQAAEQATRTFAERTGQDFDELQSVNSTIEILSASIQSLIDFPVDQIMPGEAFTFEDASIQRLVEFLQELIERRDDLNNNPFDFEDLNRQLAEVNNLAMAGFLTPLEREQAILEILNGALMELAENGMAGTAVFDALARAAGRADDNAKMYQESLDSLDFQGIDGILTSFLDIFKASNEAEMQTMSLGDRLEEFFEEYAAQIGDAILGSLDMFGEAIGSLGDDADALENATREFVRQIVELIPYLLLRAGLYYLPTNFELGVGLIVASGIAAFGIGLARGAFEDDEDDRELRNEFAKGAVFGSGLQRFQTGGAFSRAIYNTPTRFRFQGGAGVLGEAGPEAILPLQRGASGELGVRAVGASDGPLVNIEIINQTDAQIQQEETTDQNGQRNVRLLITSSVNSAMANGVFDRTMVGRYGVRAIGN